MPSSKFTSDAPGIEVPTEILELQTIAGLRQQVKHSATAFIPDPLPPRRISRDVFIGRTSEDLLEASQAVSRLDEAVATLPKPELLIKSLQRREAQRSSTIENTIATIEELALVDIEKRAPRNAVREAHNNIDAIQLAVSSPLPPSTRWLREIHATLLVGTDREQSKRPGEFRSHQSWIGKEELGFPRGLRFVPPPPGQPLADCLADLERAMNPGAEGVSRTRFPWLIELAFIHYQFETIHPFVDGNGRVGRAIINALPRIWGHVRHPVVQVSEYFADHLDAYYDALLGVSQRGDWETWVRLFCRAIASQGSNDLQRARRLADLRSAYITLLSGPRDSAKLHRLIDHLCEYSVTFAGLAATALGVSFKTAQKHLQRLEAVGFVTSRKLESMTIYIARPVVETLQAPIDRLPEIPGAAR